MQLRAQAELERRRRQQVGSIPDNWQDWLTTLFSNIFKASFAERHIELWEHIESIQSGVKPPAYFIIWGRGGGKTSNIEGAVVRLGAKEVRKFCLYIKGVQDKANESVQNIAAMLETEAVAKCYPELASRKLGKYKNSLGWRVDTLRCANDFSVVGLGLDAMARGIKIEEFRPDIIIFDDVDDIKDSPDIIRKKINIITKSILPAGSNDAAIIGGQNLMHPNSIFSKINDRTADFLYDRIVSGPYPAIDNLTYEQKPEGGYRITGGAATWEGQPLEVCEAQINEWGLSAFLQESQHNVEAPPGGIWDHVTFKRINFTDLPELVRGCVWVDPAVTDTDYSDSHGIQADALGVDDRLYRLYSWEQRTSPEDVLRRAILKAIELKLNTVGVETDQGGDLWRPVYDRVWEKLVDDPDNALRLAILEMLDLADLAQPGEMADQLWLRLESDRSAEAHERPACSLTDIDRYKPKFAAEKAGAGYGSKVHRNSLMLSDYERGMVIHVNGTHDTLEKALRRFPLTKPFDLVDASFWSWNHLRGKWRKTKFTSV